jgi:hypothetical protein
MSLPVPGVQMQWMINNDAAVFAHFPSLMLLLRSMTGI